MNFEGADVVMLIVSLIVVCLPINECKRYGWGMKVVLDHSTTGNSIWGILFVDIHILLHDTTQSIG